MSRFKPFTVAALILGAVTVYLNWYWPWGLLLFLWVSLSLQSGQTFFVEDIVRNDNPALFWVIMAMWAAFGIVMILYDLRPELVEGIFKPN